MIVQVFISDQVLEDYCFLVPGPDDAYMGTRTMKDRTDTAMNM